MTNSMTNYQTTFEATQNLVRTIELGHGENADLVASFTDNGVPVNLSGYTARAIYQPKSKWGTDDWYECPCEIVDNTAIAHWGNPYDNGDNAVKLFINLSKNGKVAYPALYRIGLFATPGFNPSPIVPTAEILDFSQYTLLNAPWALASDLSGYATTSDTQVNVKEFVNWIPSPNEYLDMPIVIKSHDEVQSIPEGYIEPYQEGAGSIGEAKAIGGQSTVTWSAGVDCALNLTATKQVLSTAYYIGSQTAKLIQPIGEWVPLSGNATITGDLTVLSSDLIHSETKTITYQNITYSNDMETYYTGDVVVAIDENLKGELTFVSDEEIPIKITGTLASNNVTVTENATLKYSQVSLVSSDRVRWIVEDESGATIGELNFSRDMQLQANSGSLHGDFLMYGSFGGVYEEEVQESKKYIYDDFSKASKLELRQLTAKVKKLSGDVYTIVDEKIPFIKKVVRLTDSVDTIHPNAHEVMGVNYVGTQSSFDIGLPTGEAEGIVDFYVDVKIPDLIPFANITVGLVLAVWLEDNFYHEWHLVYDSGKSWASMNTLGANTITRYHFRELGIVDDNGNPYLYITAKTLA